MVLLEDVSVKDLRESLAEVEGKKPTQRLIAAINYLEEDNTTMAEIAERYGTLLAGSFAGLIDSTGSPTSRSRRLSTTNREKAGRPNSLMKRTSSSSRRSTSHPRNTPEQPECGSKLESGSPLPGRPNIVLRLVASVPR